MANTMTDFAIKSEAATIISKEKSEWENATVYVTDKVAFNMREVIKACRKNYWGIFNQPKDPQTGRDKTFVPLTESLVEAAVKNIDVDQKDVEFISKKPRKIIFSRLVKAYVKNKLDKQNFGEDINKMERSLAIDGTVVWKILEEKDKNGKRVPKIKQIDLLNCYKDPVGGTIQEDNAFIERSVMTPEEVKSMPGWLDTDDIIGTENVDKNNVIGNETRVTGGGDTKLVVVYERWGLMPKRLITGNPEDKEQIEGRIVASEVDDGKYKTHLIEENKSGVKPYEEVWYTRMDVRWYGRGIAEKILFLQSYQNMIVNTRIIRATVSALGLWKIKKGAGVTPEMMKRLAVNGALPVENMDDIEQLVQKDASEASYKDEEVAQTWAERVTGAFEAVTGESVAATTTATVGAIQARQGSKGFDLVKENIGFFLVRVLADHYIPLSGKTLKKGEIVRLTLDSEELREFDEMMADEAEEEFKTERVEEGRPFIGQEEIQEVREKTLKELASESNVRFREMLEDEDLTEYDLEVYVGNEKIDKNILVTDLINFSRIDPRFAEPIGNALNDILGLNLKIPKLAAPTPQEGGIPAGVSAAQSPEQQLTQSITARAGV